MGLPSPLGRGWTATGAFTSRRGPGEGSRHRKQDSLGPAQRGKILTRFDDSLAGSAVPRTRSVEKGWEVFRP